MAAFIGLTSWQGEFTEAYLESPAPDPAQFGLPTEDDGNRSDPLLSGIANAITAYRPDVEAVTAAPTRVVIAAGIESRNTLTWRSSEAAAAALDLPLTQFPQPPRWFPRTGVRPGRAARGVRGALARGARRHVLRSGEGRQEAVAEFVHRPHRACGSGRRPGASPSRRSGPAPPGRAAISSTGTSWLGPAR